jgi:hypothetical protein
MANLATMPTNSLVTIEHNKDKLWTEKQTKNPNRNQTKTGIGEKLSLTPACKHAPSPGTFLCSRRPSKPLISNNLHHKEACVMKDPTKEHRSGSKEDIKKRSQKNSSETHQKSSSPTQTSRVAFCQENQQKKAQRKN